jgi:YVTN family beta-propeller protein
VLALVAIASCGPRSRTAGPAAETMTAPVGGVRSIDLPSPGTGLAVAPDGRTAYVTAISGVLVVDTATGRVEKAITTGDTPQAIAIGPDGKRGWVADFLSRHVIELDLGTNTVAARVRLGGPGRPTLTPSVAVSADGTRVFATDGAEENLVVIDATSGRVLQHPSLDIHPGPVAAAVDGRRVYVAGCRLSCVDGEVLVFDAATATMTSRIRLRSAPSGLALSPDAGRAYVSHGRDATISVIDLASGAVETVAVDPNPIDVAVGRDGSVYVASFGGPSLTVLDPATLRPVARVALRDPPHAVAVANDGRAYLTHAAKRLSIVDVASHGAPPRGDRDE